MKGWSKTRLGDVARLIMGQSPDSQFYNSEHDGLPFLQGCAQFGKVAPRTTVFCSRPVKTAPSKSVLFSVRAPVGEVNFADQEYCIGRGVAAIVGRDLGSEYLRHYLTFTRYEFDRRSQGSTFSAINSTGLSLLEIAYPNDKNAESKIVEILSAIDQAIDQAENLLAKYQRIQTGLLQNLLARGVDEQGQPRPLVTHGNAPALYPGWEMKPLGDIANVASGVTLGRNLEGAGMITLPYLRVFNVQDGYVDLSDVKTVTIRPGELTRYKLEKGDVLMNEGGDFDKLGRGTVWEGQIEPCLHQNHVFRVRTNRQKLLPHFLALISASPYGKRFFVLSSKQSTNLASINSTQLKAFPVPCPDVREQQRILDMYDAQQAVISGESARLAKLRRLKTGLMQDLLTGTVSVAPLLAGAEATP